MLAISTLDVQCGRFRGECGCTNDDTRYPHEVGDVGRIEIADGDLGDGGVEEELVLR